MDIPFNSTRVKHLAQFIAYKKPDSDFVFSRRYGCIGIVRGYCQPRNKERKGFSHSDSLGSPLRYSTCPCAVSSGAQHRHAEGKVAMFGCIGRETAICPRKGLPDHPSLLCATQHLWKPWHRGEDEMRMDQ